MPFSLHTGMHLCNAIFLLARSTRGRGLVLAMHCVLWQQQAGQEKNFVSVTFIKFLILKNRKILRLFQDFYNTV